MFHTDHFLQCMRRSRTANLHQRPIPTIYGQDIRYISGNNDLLGGNGSPLRRSLCTFAPQGLHELGAC